jgi:hypothetical protein
MAIETLAPDLRARVDGLMAAVGPARAELLAHPIQRGLESTDSLRRMTEHHVFAVWDFMQLLKALQQRLAPSGLPWRSRPERTAIRFVNELVLGEESDVDPRGGWISHYELYLDGMRQIGASTAAIEGFVASLADGRDPCRALEVSQAPEGAKAFSGVTLSIAHSGSLPRIAAAFCLGREVLIPEMFTRLLSGGIDAPLLRYYFERHVEVDGDSHGDLAEWLLAACCGDSDRAWSEAREAALASIAARHALWDAVLEPTAV